MVSWHSSRAARFAVLAPLAGFWLVVGFLLPSNSLAQLTRVEAIAVLERELGLDPIQPAWLPPVDFGSGAGFEGLLPAGATVEAAFDNIPPLADFVAPVGGAYVFLVDDDSDAGWAHEVRYAVLDASQPFATATVATIEASWWPRLVTSGGSEEYFEVRRTDDPPGPANPEGLVHGVAAPITPIPDPKRATSFKAQPNFQGDPCALLFTGTNDGAFNANLERYEQQMKDRGMPQARIHKKKNGKLSDLAALVTNICNLNPECDKIYVYIGAHGGLNSLEFQGASEAEKEVTEVELRDTLCPLANKNAKLCFMIQACYSGSLLNVLQPKFPGASFYTSASGGQKSYYGVVYTNNAQQSYIGYRSIVSGAFSDCWDADEADKNQPPNGTDWDEAWAWMCQKNQSVRTFEGRVFTPKGSLPQRPEPKVKGSVWVNSFTCQPGETITIPINGRVTPKDKPVTFTVTNARTGLKANTPAAATDNSDLDNVDSTPQIATVTPEGKVTGSVMVTCPPNAQPGDVAIFKVVLKIDGAVVDVDYGCVTVVAPGAANARVLPNPPSEEAPTNGGGATGRLELWQQSNQPRRYALEFSAFNHYDTAVADLFLPPQAGIQVVGGQGTPTVSAITDVLPPGGMIEVFVDVMPVFDFRTLSGFTVDMAAFDEFTNASSNASFVVLNGDEVVAAPPVNGLVPVLFQNRPNPFNPITTIRYRIPVAAPVVLTIYDVLGRRVATLVDQQLAPGQYEVPWRGLDSSGRPVASGTYLYRLEVGPDVESRKLNLVR